MFLVNQSLARKFGISRQNKIGVGKISRSLQASSYVSMEEITPRKYIGVDENCFICSGEAVKKEKIFIFGKSTVDLRGLINFAIDINLSNESDNSSIFVCKSCYRSLIKLSNARNKVVEIKNAISQQYGQKRFKRSAKSSCFDEGLDGALSTTTTRDKRSSIQSLCALEAQNLPLVLL